MALAKIAEIEAEMARTQKNKATSKHLGMLKAKLAKLRQEVLTAGSGGGGPAGEGFDVTKSGDTRIGLVGFPSVGKSTLLTKLTGTESEAASYEFTTLTCIPGTLNYKGSKIQVLDLPGIIEGAKDGKGRGRQVISTARTCNAILIVLDAMKPLTHKRLIEHELFGFGMRLNKQPPNIHFVKKPKGGINFQSKCPTITLETVKAILAEYRIHNADINIREAKCTTDDIIDVIEANRVYMPCIYVINKVDAISLEELELLSRCPHYVPISAGLEWNIDELLEKVCTLFGRVRARVCVCVSVYVRASEPSCFAMQSSHVCQRCACVRWSILVLRCAMWNERIHCSSLHGSLSLSLSLSLSVSLSLSLSLSLFSSGMGLLQDDSNLHKAEGANPGLHGTGHHPRRKPIRGGVLQPHPQGTCVRTRLHNIGCRLVAPFAGTSCLVRF